MKKLSFLAFVVVILVGFAACEKTNTATVAVTVISPTEGQILHSGDTLHVQVVFTDPTELHEYAVTVMNETDTITVMDVIGHTHTTSFTIDTSFVINVADHSDFMLDADVSNHSGATANKHVHFHVHP